jgi:hypothetical protein
MEARRGSKAVLFWSDKTRRIRNADYRGPLLLAKHTEATDRIPKRTTHENIRQEMNRKRKP